MANEVLTGTVYQGTTYPIPVTILADTVAPFDDLTAVDSISVEVYRGNGAAASGTWTWTTDTAAAVAGDPIVGHVNVPSDGSGFPTPREVVHVLVIVTLTGQEPFEAGQLALTVKSRSGVG